MKKLFIAIFTLFIMVNTVAQNKILKGRVVDNNDITLVGVSVILKGTDKGTTTNLDGEFELTNTTQSNTLVISYIGYKTKEINTSEDVTIIVLFEGNEVLQEVIVEANRKNKFSRKQSAYVAKMPLKDLENSQVYNTVQIN